MAERDQDERRSEATNRSTLAEAWVGMTLIERICILDHLPHYSQQLLLLSSQVMMLL